MRVSNSKLKVFRRCQKQYEYRYVQRLTPKERSIQLERGSWVHTLLMFWRDGEDWIAEHKRMAKEFYLLDEETREDLGDLPAECLRIMVSYIRKYRDDLERFRVIDTELDEIITLPNGLKFQIIVDVVLEEVRTGLLWAFDYKTRKRFADSDSMNLDPQLSLYYFGLETGLGYGPMGGVGYDEILTKPPTLPKLHSRGLEQRQNLFCDPVTYLREIKRHGLDPANYAKFLAHLAVKHKDTFFRRTFLPKDKAMLQTVVNEMVWTAGDIQRSEARGHFPRTFIPNDCRWSCSYRDLCLTELHGGDAEPLIRMNFSRRPERRKDDV